MQNLCIFTYIIVIMSNPYCEWLSECYVSVKDMIFARWFFWGFKYSVMWHCHWASGSSLFKELWYNSFQFPESHTQQHSVAYQNTWIHIPFLFVML